MTENEKPIDFMEIFKEITKAVPMYTDLYFTLFVQFRNIFTGANTITKSGLTSPNKGLLREFPTFGPNGYTIGQGNDKGTTQPDDWQDPANNSPLPYEGNNRVKTYPNQSP